MSYERTAAMRERLRLAAAAMPRENGRFSKVASAGDEPAKPPDKAAEAGPVGKSRSAKPAPLTAKKPSTARLSRKTLVARVSKSIERELFAVGQLLGDSGLAPAQDAEAERRARTLASLARTLRELTQMQQSDNKQKASENDAIPRDIDELRRELARRLDGLIADAKAAHPDPAGSAVDGAAE